MKSGHATALVAGMFGSFALILMTMVLLVRSGGSGTRSARTSATLATVEQTIESQAPPKSPASSRRADEAVANPTADAPTGRETAPKTPEPQNPPPIRRRRGATSSPPKVGREMQRKLEREQKEMRLLKAEMERRLEDQMVERQTKLTRLARSCESLPPGEAAQTLLTLDDETIAAILGKMDRNSALGVAAVLQRLGRPKATAF